MWRNNDISSTVVTVKKSSPNAIDIDLIDAKVTVDETNKVIKVTSHVVGEDPSSSGSPVQINKLLPVILALWWTILFLPCDSRLSLGVVATLLLLLSYSGTCADTSDGLRADVTITTPM